MASGDIVVSPPAVLRAKAALTRTRSLRWQLWPGQVTHGLRILFYHRVADEPDELAVAPQRFAAQMDRLVTDGLLALDVEEAVALHVEGRGARVVGLCFDDGYADVAENALGVLERHGFSATVFLPTGVIDGTAALSWYEHPPPMLSWEQVRALDRAGTLRFGAHTVTHPNLTAIGDDAARREIAGSKAALEAHVGHPVTTFCYPAGLFGDRERCLVAEAGFRLATSCEPGVNTPETDPLALRRLQVARRDRVLDFRAKVAGGHDTPGRLRAAYRRRRFGTSTGGSS
jgi:peptidoglycan/xylan/chitin deacetylase (PgdA/CDA1 family)